MPRGLRAGSTRRAIDYLFFGGRRRFYPVRTVMDSAIGRNCATLLCKEDIFSTLGSVKELQPEDTGWQNGGHCRYFW